MAKLSKEEYKHWTNFKSVNSSTINISEQKLIANLHSKYFNHKYYIPCSCSPRIWNDWIKDINTIYDNENRNSS